jgi:hypothetical protein
VLTSHDAHGVWVNSRALELAGVDDNTPDTPAGRIVRDEHGAATGMLLESAGELVTSLIPQPQPQDLRSALLLAQEHLFSLGITAWHDAILGRYLTLPDCVPAYLETVSDGSLRARVTGSIWWPPGAGVDAIDGILARVRECREAGFEVGSVKIMQDGICENCTAALVAPYTDVHPETRGDSVIPPEALAEITTAIDAAGLRVHFHGVQRGAATGPDSRTRSRTSTSPIPRTSPASRNSASPRICSRCGRGPIRRSWSGSCRCSAASGPAGTSRSGLCTVQVPTWRWAAIGRSPVRIRCGACTRPAIARRPHRMRTR